MSSCEVFDKQEQDRANFPLILATMNKIEASVLLVIALITCSCSIIGSCIILYVARNKVKARGSGFYHRLVCCMSIFDIFFSFVSGQSQYIMPRHSSTNNHQNIYPLAVGNTTTCNMFGAMHAGSLTGTVLYSFWLSIYFLFTVKYGWTPERVSRRFEIGMHAITIIILIGSTIIGLLWNVFNPIPIPHACSIHSYPLECKYPMIPLKTDSAAMAKALEITNITNITTQEEPIDNMNLMDCTRGQKADLFSRSTMLYGVGAIVIATFNTIRVYRHVKRTTKRGTIYNSTSTVSSLLRNVNNSSMLNITDSPLQERLKRVSWQSRYYIVAQWNSILWPVLASIIQQGGFIPVYTTTRLSFFLHLLIWIFSPLQGALNCYIYLRDRLYIVKKLNPSIGNYFRLLWTAIHIQPAQLTGFPSRSIKRRASVPPTTTRHNHHHHHNNNNYDDENPSSDLANSHDYNAHASGSIAFQRIGNATTTANSILFDIDSHPFDFSHFSSAFDIDPLSSRRSGTRSSSRSRRGQERGRTKKSAFGKRPSRHVKSNFFGLPSQRISLPMPTKKIERRMTI